MTPFSTPSQKELEERRRALRQQRRKRTVQSTWRTIFVTGLTGGLLWAVTLPIWVIRQPDQVIIEGNQLLATDTIYSLLPIHYPQPLLSIQPEAIAQRLKDEAPIAEVLITRQLYPPRLILQVQETHPVAIAYPATVSDNAPPEQREQNSSTQIGLLDQAGDWIPLDNYTNLKQTLQLPELKVIGNREQYRSAWPDFYTLISRSPVKISEVDWRDTANIILLTDLGIVHLGPYTPALTTQLRILDQMRNLPEKVDSDQVAYIDLSNPDMPMVQMVSSGVPSPIPVDGETLEEDGTEEGETDSAYEEPDPTYEEPAQEELYPEASDEYTH